MSRIVYKGLLLASLAITSMVSVADPMNIGVVDLREVFAKAPEVKVIKENLETRFKPRQQKLVEQQKAIKADMDKLQKDGSIMSNSDKKALQDNIVKQQQALEKNGSEYQQDLNSAQNQAMETFFGKVKNVIDKLAKKEKYTLVLQRENVPYMEEKLDITNKVIAALK
jgi:outer membrane protein